MLSLLLACATQSTDPAVVPLDQKSHRAAIEAELRELVALLEKEGEYDCCTEHPCLHCGLRTGGCACGEGIRKGEPVCEECALMWAKGLGAEPTVDPGKVCSFLEADRVIRSVQSAGAPCRECGEAVMKQAEALRP